MTKKSAKSVKVFRSKRTANNYAILYHFSAARVVPFNKGFALKWHGQYVARDGTLVTGSKK